MDELKQLEKEYLELREKIEQFTDRYSKLADQIDPDEFDEDTQSFTPLAEASNFFLSTAMDLSEMIDSELGISLH